MDAIKFYNRYTGEIEVEQIYGERSLRWAHETGLGRLALKAFLTKPWLSALYGKRMNRAQSRDMIAPMIEEYGLDVSEFRDDPSDFEHFNAFFYRKLKPEARPIDDAADNVVFPADGRHFLIPELNNGANFFLKGKRFDIDSLFDDSELANRFRGGSLVISRLCPVDYHRFHFPISGAYQSLSTLPGPLYSVNPIALFMKPDSLWTNHRHVSLVTGKDGLDVGVVEIGATLVGGIHPTARTGAVEKGDEKGYFSFGGSCLVTVWPRGRIRFADDLIKQSSQGVELYAKMGDKLGMIS